MEKRPDHAFSVNYFVFSLLVALFYLLFARQGSAVVWQSLVWVGLNVGLFLGHRRGSKVCTGAWLLVNFVMHLVVLFLWGPELLGRVVLFGHELFLDCGYALSGILAPLLACRLLRLNFPEETERLLGGLHTFVREKVWTPRNRRAVMGLALCLLVLGGVGYGLMRSASWEKDLDLLTREGAVASFSVVKTRDTGTASSILDFRDLSETEEARLVEALQETRLKRCLLTAYPTDAEQQYSIRLYDSMKRPIGRITLYGEDHLVLEYSDKEQPSVHHLYTGHAALIDTLEAFLA